MKVTDVWNKVDMAGLPNKSNDEINTTLARMSAGKFKLKEKFELSVIGVSTKDMQQLASSAQQMIAADFNGDAKGALAFLKTVQKSGIGPLDFSEMVRTGAAHRLYDLQKSDPDGFDRVIAGKYPDVPSLNAALGAPAPSPQAMVNNRPAPAAVTRPAQRVPS